MQHLVFLPGTLCDQRLWQFQQSRFPLSTVVNLRTQSTVEEMLHSIADVPFPSFILIGFSLGGYIAQEFALKNPQRVTQLVLIGSSAKGYPESEKELFLKSRPLIEAGLFKGITDRRLKEFLHPKSYVHPELRALIHSMAGPDAAKVYLRQVDATLNRPDLSEKLKSLHCPLTAIGGMQDQIVSFEEILALKNYVPNANIEILEECGHFVPLEKPDEVNAILSKII
jgi:pimeloyl-ACP methyl ester carboxylesterase